MIWHIETNLYSMQSSFSNKYNDILFLLELIDLLGVSNLILLTICRSVL